MPPSWPLRPTHASQHSAARPHAQPPKSDFSGNCFVHEKERFFQKSSVHVRASAPILPCWEKKKKKRHGGIELAESVHEWPVVLSSRPAQHGDHSSSGHLELKKMVPTSLGHCGHPESEVAVKPPPSSGRARGLCGWGPGGYTAPIRALAAFCNSLGIKVSGIQNVSLELHTD